MMKNHTIYLVTAIVTLLIDLTPQGHYFGAGVLKPVGAVALVMFIIIRLFGGEVAKFDTEEHAKGGGKH